MGNSGSGKLWENPALGQPSLVQPSLVDWSLGPFWAEQCFHNDFQSFPNQLRMGIVDWSLGPFRAEQCFLDCFSRSQNNFIWVYISYGIREPFRSDSNRLMAVLSAEISTQNNQ